MRLNWRHDLQPGVERAAAKKRRISADVDERVSKALGEGVKADARVLSAKLLITYHSARSSLIRLKLWKRGNGS